MKAFFNLFNKSAGQNPVSAGTLNILGPKYLRGRLGTPCKELVRDIPKSNSNRFVGQVFSLTGGSWFRVGYHGALDNDLPIVETQEGRLRLYLVDAETDECVTVFDKGQHGWAALFEDRFEVDIQPNKSDIDRAFQPDETFKVVIVVYYNNSTKQELLLDSVNGKVILSRGGEQPLQDVFDDAFDAIDIYIFDKNGTKFLIISEELA